MVHTVEDVDRRGLMMMAAAAGVSLLAPRLGWAKARGFGGDLSDVSAVIDRQQPEALKRLQDWIALPTIVAEQRNVQEGAVYMQGLLKDAGFQTTSIIQTDGSPGVFGVMDNGAPRTVGMYFMYDVKQFDPSEWSSPPLEGRIVDRPGLGKVMIGRGATNQKGPQASFLAALHALKASGRKMPVNIVVVAEGEEEIASPHFPQIVHRPEVLAALSRCKEVWMPMSSQSPSGAVEVVLGAKGTIEVELTCTSKAWGRGALGDIHSSFKADVDSPVWRMIKALSTLTSEDGNDPTIDGFNEHVKPLTARQKELLDEEAARVPEADVKKTLGVQRWVRDLSYREAIERLASQPTVNIEGMYAGYTGPGGKTLLPSKAVVKLDLRLVPDQTAAEAAEKLKAHLARRGYGDIQVNVTGGYNPTQTDEHSALIQTSLAVYKAAGLDVGLSPRAAGSWPGYIFTDPPVSLPAGHFGFGHGALQHVPNEYFVIESTVPKLRGMRGATLGYAEFLYALAAT
jgi:acetylornithine deacetylase/succinyl-diaminopimelate desuccinylase-like protein